MKKNNNNNVNVNNVNNNNVNVTFIETANNMLSAVGKELRNANKEYNSISQVLKDMQRAALMDKGYKVVFESLKIDVSRKIDAKTFFNSLHVSQSFTDKKGNTCYGIWGYKVTRDANGNEISREKVLRKVTSWSPNKVFKMIAQSIAIKNDNGKK